MKKIHKETIVGVLKREIATNTEAGTPRGCAEAALLRDSLDAFFNIVNEVEDLRQALDDRSIND
jgi:hypothetical protein